MVKEFVFESHYKMLCSWWHAYGFPEIPEDMLPTYGLVVPGVAAGFLIATDCNLGLLEYYIGNPQAKKEHRDLALDQITRGLLKYGESIGISNFKCDTQIPAIKNRAERFGFVLVGEFSNYFLKAKE